MSIQDRIDEGLSPADARLKESLREDQPAPRFTFINDLNTGKVPVDALQFTAGGVASLREDVPLEKLLERLSCAAVDAELRALDHNKVATALRAAADLIVLQEKRYADGLQAWKANNAWHAARIAELEQQVTSRKANSVLS